MQNSNGLLPNYFGNNNHLVQIINLTQIEGFTPVESFTDSSHTHWILAKAASNSTVGIPDPRTIQIIEFWHHAFPRKDLEDKVFIYVVEGVKIPQIATEQPMKVLFQWFSDRNVSQFTPDMITPEEWQRANVYAAPVLNKWNSILNAICQVKTEQPLYQTENKLLQVEGLSNGSIGRNQETTGE